MGRFEVAVRSEVDHEIVRRDGAGVGDSRWQDRVEGQGQSALPDVWHAASNQRRQRLDRSSHDSALRHTDVGFKKPGSYEKLTFASDTKWAYSDGGPNWLAKCVTLAYPQDVDKLMFDRVFTPLGIQRTDFAWRSNSYRDKHIDGIPRRELGSGTSDDGRMIHLVFSHDDHFSVRRATLNLKPDSPLLSDSKSPR